MMFLIEGKVIVIIVHTFLTCYDLGAYTGIGVDLFRDGRQSTSSVDSRMVESS